MGKKVKINLYVSEELLSRLKKQRELTGAPVSEILRRAADEYLTREEEKNAQN